LDFQQNTEHEKAKRMDVTAKYEEQDEKQDTHPLQHLGELSSAVAALGCG